jgi:transcriptional regulator with XRE-family HTH domain
MSRGRETVEERRARLMPGAQWIVKERERRGWSGRELARRLSINQDRISAYERAQDEPPPEVARGLARVFELDEVQVWRCLGKPLPAEFRTDEEAIAYVERIMPGFLGRVEHRLAGENPGPKERHSGSKGPEFTRPGDPPISESQARTNAV